MTATELLHHPTVAALISIQEETHQKDTQFAKALRLGIHGANWGKIKACTYDGNFLKAVEKLTLSLEEYLNPVSGEIVEGIVILDHVRDAMNAVDIACHNEDEHRLVVLSGVRGSGKTRTLSLIHSKHAGVMINARPSWAGSYLSFLNGFASALGLGKSRSKGEAESLIIDHLNTAAPAVLCIDEFNHFSADAINALKMIINETKWKIVTATLPHHLSRMASDRATAQESVQFFRRAVAIIHIGHVSVRTVQTIARAYHPELDITGHTNDLAAIANELHRLDTLCPVLAEAAQIGDVAKAIALHRRSCTISQRPTAA